MATATASCHLKKKIIIQHPSASLIHPFPMLSYQKASLDHPKIAAKRGKKENCSPFISLYNCPIWVLLSWKPIYYRGLWGSSSSTSHEHLPSLAGHQQSHFRRNIYCIFCYTNKKPIIQILSCIQDLLLSLTPLPPAKSAKFKA